MNGTMARLGLFAIIMAVALALPLRAAETKPAETTRATPDAPVGAPIDRVVNGQEPKGPWRRSLEKRMADLKVSALSIAIVDGGRVVWAQGFGVREVGGHGPVTATTLFQAASCSKPVAMSAMLRLVDKGTLSLDTNVNRYLTSWKFPGFGLRVVVAQE